MIQDKLKSLFHGWDIDINLVELEKEVDINIYIPELSGLSEIEKIFNDNFDVIGGISYQQFPEKDLISIRIKK
jgi:hypothetical protein